MLYGICVIHSIWRLVIIKWIDKGFKWVDNQVDLLNEDGDIEAEHKIIFVFFGLLFIFMMIAFFAAFFNVYASSIITLDAAIFIFISLLVGCRIWKTNGNFKKLFLFSSTILLYFLSLFSTFYFVFINKSAGDFGSFLETMIMIFVCWWVSYMFNPILTNDYKNVYDKKIGRFFLKLLIISVCSFIVIAIQIDANGSMITAILTIIISLTGTKEFCYMLQLFSNNTFNNEQISLLREKLDGGLAKIKVGILLFEFSYILTFCLFSFFSVKHYLVYLSKNSIINQNNIIHYCLEIQFFISILIFIFLIFSLKFLLSNVYSKPFEKMLQNKKD